MLEDRWYMRQPENYRPAWPTSVKLIVALAVIYLLQLITGLATGSSQRNFIMEYLALRSDAPFYFWIWQLFTYQFLHHPTLIFHLLLNALVLYFFGRPVEERIGAKRFWQVYLAGGVLGGVVQISLSWLFTGHFGHGITVGASAGIFALIAAFSRLNWEQPITLLAFLILPITMRAKYLLIILAIIGGLGLMVPGGQTAHGAHLGGLLLGVLYVDYFMNTALAHASIDWSKMFPSKPQGAKLVRMPSSHRAEWRRAAQRKQQAADIDTSEEYISKEVDPILDKISAHGIQSLTDRERKILEAARSRMGKPH